MKNKKKIPEEPEIYAIKMDNRGIAFSRKEFLETIGVIGVGLALNPMEGCAVLDGNRVRKVKQMDYGTITRPCGTPIPKGATCICDCISSSRTFPEIGETCTCNTISLAAGTKLGPGMTCVCNTIFVASEKSYNYSKPTYKTYYYTTSFWHPN